jgi:hypothetical protein
MSTNFWDDPAVKPPTADFVKFEKVGDGVEGTVVKLGKRTFNAGTADERVAVEVTFDDDVPTLTAGQVLLQRALYDFKPQPGDVLGVQLAAIEKKGGKTLKKFKVEITRTDGSTEVIDQTQE